MNEFVAVKALGASDLAVTMLLMLPTLTQFVNLYWTGVSGSEARRVFLLVGVPARLSLLLVGLVHGSGSFLLLATLAASASTVLVPAQNALYQANYAGSERGRMFASVSMLAAITTVAVATLLGWLYDRDETLFRIAYPAAGVASAAGALYWYRIRWRQRPGRLVQVGPAAPGAVAAVPRPAPPSVAARVAAGLLGPFRTALALFRADRDFLRFEAAFMSYGLGYMLLQPVLPIFLVHELGVAYAEAARAKGLLFYGSMVVFLPLAGRLNDRIGAFRLASVAFLLLGAYPLLLLLARDMALVYAAYAVFGIAMAGVSVAWTLGPLSLAGEQNAASYMGAHVALVGVRGLLGYPLGFALLRYVSPRAAFGVALLFGLLAAALMHGVALRRGPNVVA